MFSILLLRVDLERLFEKAKADSLGVHVAHVAIEDGIKPTPKLGLTRLLRQETPENKWAFSSFAAAMQDFSTDARWGIAFVAHRPHTTLTLLRTVAWVTKLFSGTSSVNQTFPPMVEPRPTTIRPRIVAPA